MCKPYCMAADLKFSLLENLSRGHWSQHIRQYAWCFILPKFHIMTASHSIVCDVHNTLPYMNTSTPGFICREYAPRSVACFSLALGFTGSTRKESRLIQPKLQYLWLHLTRPCWTYLSSVFITFPLWLHEQAPEAHPSLDVSCFPSP